MTTNLVTARLKLTPLFPDDVDDRYVGWLNDPAVVRYSEQRHRRHTIESCRDFVASIDHTHSHLWAISVEGRHIGNISAYRDRYNGTAEVGMLIGETAVWGSGYGREAWGAVCDWLLAGKSRMVTAGTMAENKAMIRIFKSTGMIINGYRPGYFLLDGKPVDMITAHRSGEELPRCCLVGDAMSQSVASR